MKSGDGTEVGHEMVLSGLHRFLNAVAGKPHTLWVLSDLLAGW